MICPNCGCNCETGEVPIAPGWEDSLESAQYDAALAKVERGEVGQAVQDVQKLRRLWSLEDDRCTN